MCFRFIGWVMPLLLCCTKFSDTVHAKLEVEGRRRPVT